MNSNKDKIYKKLLALDEIYNFVVYFLFRIIFIIK
jgi:hypothetical protein